MTALVVLGGIALVQLEHHRLKLTFHPRGRIAYCSSSLDNSSSNNLLTLQDRIAKYSRFDHPAYRKWKDKEAKILQDVDPIIQRTKLILHSNRYMDGEKLSLEDQKEVIEKLLAHHPHCRDKIGCGLDSIMVDRHPQFKSSRCLFVVRTDGGWIDFSYQKCLRSYIRDKFPSDAERFIKEHFKRGSG